MDNQSDSNLADRSTSLIADPLQVGKDLFWDLYVDGFRIHGSAPDAVNVWHSPRRTQMYEVVDEF